MAKFAFQHPSFETAEPHVSYFVAERSTVLFGLQEQPIFRQVCQVIFSKRGAIFAQFPYFPSTLGMVAKAKVLVSEQLSSELSFTDSGVLSSHHVKYSHPADGLAHFSQDKRHKTMFYKQSVPLRTGFGHLFELHAYGVDHFAILAPGSEVAKRLYLPFLSPDAISAVSVTAEWRLKSELVAYAQQRGKALTAMDQVPRRSDGALFTAALLGAPPSLDYHDHLLLMSVAGIATPPNAPLPSMTLFGAWDYPLSPLRPGTVMEFLTFTYPPIGPEDLLRSMPSGDYLPRAG